MIKDKFDTESVEKIIAVGYPENSEFLDDMLEWTADPNWPVSLPIFKYFIRLRKDGVGRVLKLAASLGTDKSKSPRNLFIAFRYRNTRYSASGRWSSL